MSSQLVELVEAKWISITGGALLIMAALMALLFGVSGDEGGSIMGINIWLLIGLGLLLAGLLLFWDNVR